MLCEYDLKNEAKYQMKNGRWCCCEKWQLCPKIREDNRLRNIDKKHSKETIEKMSKTAIEKGFGKWMKEIWKDSDSIFNSKEFREKLSLSALGHIPSKETRDKISIKNSGEKNGFFGKHHTYSNLEIISISSQRMWKNENIRYKLLNYEGRIENCRKGALAAYKKIKDKGFCNTKPEIEMKKILSELKIEYVQSKEIINIKHCYASDFFIEKYNLIIEVDGTYWHNYPLGRDLDKIRGEELSKAGYKLIRFWEGMFDINLVNEKFNNIIKGKG